MLDINLVFFDSVYTHKLNNILESSILLDLLVVLDLFLVHFEGLGHRFEIWLVCCVEFVEQFGCVVDQILFELFLWCFSGRVGCASGSVRVCRGCCSGGGPAMRSSINNFLGTRLPECLVHSLPAVLAVVSMGGPFVVANPVEIAFGAAVAVPDCE